MFLIIKKVKCYHNVNLIVILLKTLFPAQMAVGC